MGRALDKYIEANKGSCQRQVSELGPFFESPIENTILQRYQMLVTGKEQFAPR